MTDFLKENNVRLLWEVLMDADILRSKPKEFIEYILHIYGGKQGKVYEGTWIVLTLLPQNFSVFFPTAISHLETAR